MKKRQRKIIADKLEDVESSIYAIQQYYWDPNNREPAVGHIYNACQLLYEVFDLLAVPGETHPSKMKR